MGGAGAFSDGKLIISTEVGGFLGDFVDQPSLLKLLKTADDIYVAHGAPGHLFGDMSPKLEVLADRARLADLVDQTSDLSAGPKPGHETVLGGCLVQFELELETPGSALK